MDTRSRRTKRRNGGDHPFLAGIESCWATLASAIIEGNGRVPLEQLQPAARQALELLVFLEICHRRGLLPGHHLERWIAADERSCRLGKLVRWAEDRLGSGLCRVHPNRERGDAWPAGLSTARIDARALRAVVAQLAALAAALDPVACGPELLGAIHQRLLGKRLRPEAGGRCRVETNAEARKQGGVYYTPEYVAQYIVTNSVGPRLSRQPPDSTGRIELKILDPACGCGSFLLAACRLLLAWCREHRVPDAARTAARCLHGVDVDPEAVLAARRSLWLELAAQRPKRERQSDDAGPLAARSLVEDLAENVRCGDVLAESAADEPGARFDVVIGNPPYRRELSHKHLLDRIAATELGRRYRAPRMDLSYYFVHRSLELLKPGGGLSFIVGSYWTSASGAEKLLAALRESAHVEEIFLLDRLNVFPDVAGRHMILRVTKGGNGRPTTIKRAAAAAGPADAEPFVRGTAPVVVFQKSAEQLFRGGRLDVEPPCDELLAKLAQWPALGTLGKVRQGIAENPATVTRKANERHGGRWRPGEGVFALTRDELARLRLPPAEMPLVRPYHDLCDLGRYFLAREPSRMLIYATAETCPDVDRCLAVREHLARFRPIMEARRETRKGVRPWWQLHWPRDERLWRSAKIIAVQMARRPAFVPAMVPVYVPFSVNVFVPHAHVREHLHYVTALLNSRLLWKWYLHHAKRRGVGLELNGHVLARTPVRTIDFSDPADKTRHDRLVGLVDKMLRLKHSGCSPQSCRPGRRSSPDPEINKRMDAIDRQIDRLVYELYEATSTEIAIVEAATSQCE